MIKWNCSEFKDCDLLILPRPSFSILVTPLKAPAIRAKNAQILGIWPANSCTPLDKYLSFWNCPAEQSTGILRLDRIWIFLDNNIQLS